MTNPPDVFNFSDYREYLAAWIEHARAHRSSNVSRLAAKIGVHTSFLAHVLGGSKNLSFEQATEISDAFTHTHLERDYFFSLLQLERAGSVKLKKYWTDKKSEIVAERAKLRSRVGTHHELTSEERAIFYSSWIYVAVFVATAIDAGQTLAQVAERFRISREEAEKILSFLVRTGICHISGGGAGNRGGGEKGDLYTMGKSVIYLSNDSPLIVKHHTNWRIRAIQKMDTREPDELFFTSPMSMSLTDFLRIRDLLAKAIETSLEICKDSPAEEVVCLNIDFFRSMAK